MKKVTKTLSVHIPKLLAVQFARINLLILSIRNPCTGTKWRAKQNMERTLQRLLVNHELLKMIILPTYSDDKYNRPIQTKTGQRYLNLLTLLTF